MNPALVVGLGNPGSNYEYTRHNLGFRTLDLAAVEFDATWKTENDVMVANTSVNGEKVFFLKPQTFMNASGAAIARFVQFYKIPLDRVLIVHDDLDLPFGDIRPAFDRGPAGHNGVVDIIEKLGTQAFHRLRIGIGSNRQQNIPAEDYVLQKFSREEEADLIETMKKASDLIVSWVRSTKE